jgi:hypothetical protein
MVAKGCQNPKRFGYVLQERTQKRIVIKNKKKMIKIVKIVKTKKMHHKIALFANQVLVKSFNRLICVTTALQETKEH